MKEDLAVKVFDNELRKDSNGLFLTLEHKVDKIEMTIINNVSDEVITNTTLVDEKLLFLPQSLLVQEKVSEEYIKGLSSEIKNEIKRMHILYLFRNGTSEYFVNKI